jgi:hypothetical protein
MDLQLGLRRSPSRPCGWLDLLPSEPVDLLQARGLLSSTRVLRPKRSTMRSANFSPRPAARRRRDICGCLRAWREAEREASHGNWPWSLCISRSGKLDGLARRQSGTCPRRYAWRPRRRGRRRPIGSVVALEKHPLDSRAESARPDRRDRSPPPRSGLLEVRTSSRAPS